MMNNMKSALLLTLSVSLAACAPGVQGGQSYAPIVADSPRAGVKAKAGQTTYVQYSYDRDLLEISDGRFDSLKVNFNLRSASGDVNSPELAAIWLTMTAKGLPADWKISLNDAALRKEVVKTTTSATSTDIRYMERIRVIYKVTLPAGATGTQRAVLSFKDENTNVGDVDLSITAVN